MKRITTEILQNLHNHCKIELRHTSNQGPAYKYYTSKEDAVSGDWVSVPEPDRFIASKYYYKTLLHELSHAACSKTRLDLQCGEDEEEIAVEASALTICFISGYNLWASCLGYITNWSIGAPGTKMSNVLLVKDKSQWDSIQTKTDKIVRYLLNS